MCPVRPIPQPCAPGGAPNHLADAQAYDWNSHLQPGYAANTRALFLVTPPPPMMLPPREVGPLPPTHTLSPFSLCTRHISWHPFRRENAILVPSKSAHVPSMPFWSPTLQGIRGNHLGWRKEIPPYSCTPPTQRRRFFSRLCPRIARKRAPLLGNRRCPTSLTGASDPPPPRQIAGGGGGPCPHAGRSTRSRWGRRWRAGSTPPLAPSTVPPRPSTSL